MAVGGSTPMFHLREITPEAKLIDQTIIDNLEIIDITENDINSLNLIWKGKGDKVDVVVFAAPQLSIIEMKKVANLCKNNNFVVPVMAVPLHRFMQMQEE